MIPKFMIKGETLKLSFEDKVKSMTASEIILAMVEALTHPPIIDIDMDSYGRYGIKTTKYLFGLIKTHKEVCFGCAATNTICQISGIKFNTENINGRQSRAKAMRTEYRFLSYFECAINHLRQGSICAYNSYASGQFAKIQPVPGFDPLDRLPKLNDNYTNKDLQPYIRLANYNKMLELAE